MNKDNDKNDIVMIELDRPRELKFTHKVMKRFCAATGTKMSEIQDAVEDYDNMTRLIYEMLRREDPDLTQEQCDDLLDTVSIGLILQKGAEAIAAGFGEMEGIEGAEGYPFAKRLSSAGQTRF